MAPNTRPTYAYRTHSGIMMNLADPAASGPFRLDDIAHHLARVCRYGGAVDGFYSVASHSVYVARELERAGYPERVVRAGLLHDAPEAYLGDMTSGLKRLMPEYRVLEARYAALVETQYGVDIHDPAIRDADLRARLAEVRDLFVDVPYDRAELLGGEGDRQPYATRVVAESPADAEWSFLALAARLGLAV